MLFVSFEVFFQKTFSVLGIVGWGVVVRVSLPPSSRCHADSGTLSSLPPDFERKKSQLLLLV
jgi:hypothetical protein